MVGELFLRYGTGYQTVWEIRPSAETPSSVHWRRFNFQLTRVHSALELFGQYALQIYYLLTYLLSDRKSRLIGPTDAVLQLNKLSLSLKLFPDPLAVGWGGLLASLPSNPTPVLGLLRFVLSRVWWPLLTKSHNPSVVAANSGGATPGRHEDSPPWLPPWIRPAYCFALLR